MSCLACGNQHYKQLYDGILSCTSCKFSWADITLSEEEWKKIYNKNYFFGEEYADYLKEEKALRKNFHRNLKWMISLCPDGKLLELGCAYGFFLDEARKHYTTEGVDIHADGYAHARNTYNLNAKTENFLTMPFPEKSFNVICAWDVLEHLPRPDLFIQKAGQLLKTNGYLFFSTLDITSFSARIQGKHWRQIHPLTPN